MKCKSNSLYNLHENVKLPETDKVHNLKRIMIYKSKEKKLKKIGSKISKLKPNSSLNKLKKHQSEDKKEKLKIIPKEEAKKKINIPALYKSPSSYQTEINQEKMNNSAVNAKVNTNVDQILTDPSHTKPNLKSVNYSLKRKKLSYQGQGISLKELQQQEDKENKGNFQENNPEHQYWLQDDRDRLEKLGVLEDQQKKEQNHDQDYIEEIENIIHPKYHYQHTKEPKNPKNKRVIQRPNTALNIINVTLNKNTENKKEKDEPYDYDRSKQTLKKIKNMNENLKRNIKTFKLRDITDIKINSKKRAESAKNSKTIDEYNSEIYNFTFKPEDIIKQKARISTPIKKNKNKKYLPKKTQEQINNIVNNRPQSADKANKHHISNTPNYESKVLDIVDRQNASKENIKELNGIYLIKNEIKMIKQNDNYNFQTIDVVNKSIEKKETNETDSPVFHCIKPRKIIKKEKKCNTETTYIQKHNEIENSPKINQINLDASFDNPPNLNEHFKKIINIEEGIRGGKIKSFFKRHFSHFKNDESLNITNINDKLSNNLRQSVNVNNSLHNEKGTQNLIKEKNDNDEENLKKIKLRVIKRGNKISEQSSKIEDKPNKTDPNDNKDIKQNKTNVSDVEISKNDPDIKILRRLAKPPTPKRIKLSNLSDYVSNIDSASRLKTPDDKSLRKDSSLQSLHSNISEASCRDKLKTLDNSFSSLKQHLREVKNIQIKEKIKVKEISEEKIDKNITFNTLDSNIIHNLKKKTVPSPKIMKNHPKIKHFLMNIVNKK